MLGNKKNSHPDEVSYRNRFMVAILITEIILICMIRFWPDVTYEPREITYEYVPEQVLMDEIQITEQNTSPPPPPRPRIPHPEPTDEIVEYEIEIDFDFDLPELPDLEEGGGTGVFGDEDKIVSNPQIPPTVVRIVEATAPEEVPDELKGNLEMIVNFLVDENGRVLEVSISEIRKYTNGDFERLPFVQHGLMDAVLEAAMQWRFRPARQNGEPVKAFIKQRFNY